MELQEASVVPPKYKLSITRNCNCLVQERRTISLSSEKEEIILNDLLSVDVNVIPCEPSKDQIHLQQEQENMSYPILLSSK